jgi:hypothetical protein
MNGFEVVAKMAPAKEVGGDYYDIIEVDGNRAWVTIGDVSGHGFDSGLVMMMAQAGISLSSIVLDAGPLGAHISHKVIREMLQGWALTTICSDRDAVGKIFNRDGGKHQDVILYKNWTETEPK